jgi:hypothetical protein
MNGCRTAAKLNYRCSGKRGSMGVVFRNCLILVLTTFSFWIVQEGFADCPDLDPEPALQYADWKRQWKECQKDSDCESVPGICGGWIGVNKEYKEKAEIWSSDQNSVVDCVQSPEPDPKPKGECRKNCCLP